VDFSIVDYEAAFTTYWRKNIRTVRLHYLVIGFKKIFYSEEM
jgi:hypothetical protein